MRKGFKRGFGMTLGVCTAIFLVKMIRGIIHVTFHDEENDILEDDLDEEVINIEL